MADALAGVGKQMEKAAAEIVGGPELWKSIQTRILSPSDSGSRQEALLSDLKKELTKQTELQKKTADNTASMRNGVPAFPQ
jgi:hypothetical protein